MAKPIQYCKVKKQTNKQIKKKMWPYDVKKKVK